MSNPITPLPVNTQNNVQNSVNHATESNTVDQNEEPFDDVFEREMSGDTAKSEADAKPDENIRHDEVNTKDPTNPEEKVVNQTDNLYFNELPVILDPGVHAGLSISVLATPNAQPPNNLIPPVKSTLEAKHLPQQQANVFSSITREADVKISSTIDSPEVFNTLDKSAKPSPSVPGIANQLNKQNSLTQDSLAQDGVLMNMNRQYVAGQSVAETANFAEQGKTMLQSIESGLIPSNRVNESTSVPLTDSMPQSGLSQVSTLSPMNTPTVVQPIGVSAADLQVTTQVGQPKWDGDFAQKIVLMANQKNQVAEIRLNPAHLGPVEVSLNIVNDQGTQAATAQFVSGHVGVREAIEASLPKLREMLAESGIELGNVTVGSESSEQQTSAGQQEQGTGTGKSSNSSFSANVESGEYGKVTIVPQRHEGLVNTFA